MLQQFLEFGDLLPLIGVDDVKRLEIVAYIHAEASRRLPWIFCGDLSCFIRHVGYVADTGFHDVALAEEASDRPRLPRRLDDNQLATAVGPGLGVPGSFILDPCCHVSHPLHPAIAQEATAGKTAVARRTGLSTSV